MTTVIGSKKTYEIICKILKETDEVEFICSKDVVLEELGSSVVVDNIDILTALKILGTGRVLHLYVPEKNELWEIYDISVIERQLP